MFYGEYEHTLDKKGRLIIPSRFRDVLKEHGIEKLYITRGLDKCLFVFAEDEWRLQEQKFRSLSFTKQEARRFNRLYFSGAIEVVADRQHRILIPQYLKDFAGIQRHIVIVGVSSRIEIWSRERWREFTASAPESFEELAEKLLDSEGK